jgi:hypothetical protein
MVPSPRSLSLLMLLAAGLGACLPDLKEDTAACDGPEICNGEDDDCDGSIDENASDALSWYPDDDGDGYGDPATSTLSCEQPSGYVPEDRASGENADCDDGDDGIHPGADETWYDGVDSDCSGGSDYDRDGDGHDHEAFGGEDCDDEDEAVHPEADEVWYDGVDQDCDEHSDYDQDRDGHDDGAHGGDDCDDLDDAVYPGADEIWYDGVDQDCDGRSDYDQDHDGHDSDAHLGDDCDDEDAFIHPGVEETWYDGVDSDCSGGSDYDQDGDGYELTGATGDDCDDTEWAIRPDALEWIDGEDNNCDGVIDELTLDAAPVVLGGEAGGDSAGCSVAGVGDVNADGYDDLLIGAYGNSDGARDGGAAYLLYGPVSSGNLATADGILRGTIVGSMAGYAVAKSGDTNADGYEDLFVSAPWEGSETSELYTGAAYLVHGPVSGELDLDDADLIMRAVEYDDGAGWFISGDVDVTGDGSPDLLLGATDISSVVDNGGGAYLVDGQETGLLALDHAHASFYGSQQGAFAGTSVTLVDDMDGDGVGEVLVGAPTYDDANTHGEVFEDVGAAFLFHGPVSGSYDLMADADAVLDGEYSGDKVGDCVANAGDVTGDGLGDLLVGASEAGEGARQGPGKVYLMQGPITASSYLLYTSTAIFEGPAADTDASLCPSAGVGDMDLDGNHDVVVAAYTHGLNGAGSGTVYLHTGPFGGTITPLQAEASFQGTAAGDNAGFSVAGAGDTNADGYLDLLVGAPYADLIDPDDGGAYLLLGSPLLLP